MDLPIRFVTHDRPTPQGGAVCVSVRPDRANPQLRWDDFGFRTTFKVAVSIQEQPFENIGDWKIAPANAKASSGKAFSTTLPESFETLPDTYISVAQALSNYDRLCEATGPEIALHVLKGLGDVSVSAKQTSSLRRATVFGTSLVRFSSAHEAFQHGPSRLADLGVIKRPRSVEETFTFRFECQLDGFAKPHVVDFGFSRSPDMYDLRRLWAIVGRNGSGKTQLLSALAAAVTGLGRDSTIEPRPSFSGVMAVSYSPWDAFHRPKKSGLEAYEYAGLRASDSEGSAILLDAQGARRLASDARQRIERDARRENAWQESMRSCGFDRVGCPLRAAIRDSSAFDSALLICSAGEQLAAIVLTRLVAYLDRGRLIVFDEPELHMHPNLLAALLRTIHSLLVEFDAFCLIGTHSPFPLQELPSACIKVVTLVDDVPIVQGIDAQTFGASLAEIVEAAFPERREEKNFASILRKLRDSGVDREKLRTALGGEESRGLGFYLAALARREGL